MLVERYTAYHAASCQMQANEEVEVRAIILEMRKLEERMAAVSDRFAQEIIAAGVSASSAGMPLVRASCTIGDATSRARDAIGQLTEFLTSSAKFRATVRVDVKAAMIAAEEHEARAETCDCLRHVTWRRLRDSKANTGPVN